MNQATIVPSILSIKIKDLQSAQADLQKKMSEAEARALLDIVFKEVRGECEIRPETKPK